MSKLNPFLWLAWLLDIRCPNCGVLTGGLLFWRCPNCGHPAPAKYECPKCGLHSARTRKGLCPRCGSRLPDGQSHPLQSGSPEKTIEIPIEPPVESTIEPPVATLPAETSKPEPPVQTPPPAEPQPEPELPATPAKIENTPAPDVPVPEAVAGNNPGEAVAPPELNPSPPVAVPSFDELVSVPAEQLLEVFKIDSGVADAACKEKTLRIKGSIEKIYTEDTANPYVVLGSPDTAVTQKVQCVFEPKYLPVISRMIAGQKVTVLGKYDGYVTDIRLIDCMPVG